VAEVVVLRYPGHVATALAEEQRDEESLQRLQRVASGEHRSKIEAAEKISIDVDLAVQKGDAQLELVERAERGKAARILDDEPEPRRVAPVGERHATRHVVRASVLQLDLEGRRVDA